MVQALARIQGGTGGLMDWVIFAVVAIASLLVASRSNAASVGPTGAHSFPDGGVFYSRFSADFLRSGAPAWLDRAAAYIIAEIETDFGRSNALAATNSYTNRHIGSGKGDWTGHAYTTSPPPGRQPEVLRIYSDRPQSIRDLAQLIGDSPIYSSAYNALQVGNIDGFFVGLVAGNGKEGYVGAYPSAKAAGYLAGLRSRYARSFK